MSHLVGHIDQASLITGSDLALRTPHKQRPSWIENSMDVPAVSPQPVVIASVVDAIAHAFVGLVEASPEDERAVAKSSAASIQDEFSRFKLWAGNIAAHRKGRRSLEYR